MTPGWLQLAPVTLHSGRRSEYKIECDEFTDLEIDTMCQLLAKIIPPFGSVFGVPTGGTRLEDAIRPFMSVGPALFIDDVWTTGGSMKQYHTVMKPDHGIQCDCLKVVLFTRGFAPTGVISLFDINSRLWDR